MVPPAAASFLILASSRLRGWSLRARQLECEQIMGERDISSIWSKTSSEAWLASSTTPRSFASLTNSLPKRRQAAPFLLVGGGIGKLVVEEMDGPGKAHAQLMKTSEQSGVVAENSGIFDRLIDDDLALGGDAFCILFQEGELELLGMRRHHFADFRRAQECGIAHRAHAFRRQRRLGRVDGEEPAIQPAFDHARIVGLGEILIDIVLLHDVPARPRQIGGHVEMGVDADQLLVQRPRVVRRPGESRRQRQRRRSIHHQCPPRKFHRPLQSEIPGRC